MVGISLGGFISTGEQNQGLRERYFAFLQNEFAKEIALTIRSPHPLSFREGRVRRTLVGLSDIVNAKSPVRRCFFS
jgi:hypothetical protein